MTPYCMSGPGVPLFSLCMRAVDAENEEAQGVNGREAKGKCELRWGKRIHHNMALCGQDWEGNMADCEKKITAHKVAVRGILQTLANLEKEVKDTKAARDNAVRSEIARIRQQVTDSRAKCREAQVR